MPKSNEELFEAAVDAAKGLFEDTSVTPAETRDQLKGLIEEIEMLITTIPE